MIVVADTSPINYLVLIGEIRVLPQLFPTVIVPLAVADELRSSDAPKSVQQWIRDPPGWLLLRPALLQDQRLSDLDKGERDALALALQLRADLVLIDERDARSVARLCRLEVAGTLRILANAANRNLVSLDRAFDLLRQTSFRAKPKLFDTLLAHDRLRRESIEHS